MSKKEAYLQHLVDHCNTGREPGHYPLRSASSITVESRDGWKVAASGPGRVIAKCKMKDVINVGNTEFLLVCKGGAPWAPPRPL
jgi:hypothetical protein